MFTGLVQSKGELLGLTRNGAEARLRLRPLHLFENFVLGESIAVNGACLTLEKHDGKTFTAFASSETLSLTNLGGLQNGALVNLERALRLGDSLGGHLVSGHVDCLCQVLFVRPVGSSMLYRFSLPPEQAPYVVPKGSVAVDGVSLTVNACGPDFFEVNVIPATQRATTMEEWRPGREINLETDLIGKYVQRMLHCYGEQRVGMDKEAPGRELDLDFFRQNGF